MNLVEEYVTNITNVRKEEIISSDLVFIIYYVSATFNCYGIEETTTKILSEENYRSIKKQGYYLT